MISALYSTCHQPAEQQPYSCLYKISLIVLEFLLVVAGCIFYFTGVGVIPSAILWGVPLVIEVATLICEICKHISEISVAHQITEQDLADDEENKRTSLEFSKALQEIGLVEKTSEGPSHSPPFFDHLINTGIIAFNASSANGLMLIAGEYAPPNPSYTKYKNVWDSNAKLVTSMITDWLYITSIPRDEGGFSEFWALIAKCENSPLIVMTAGAEEATRRYWPDACQSMHTDSYVIDSDNSGVVDEVAFRSFTVKEISSGNTRQVSQFLIEGSSQSPYALARLSTYASACLKQTKESQKTIIVQDDNGQGRAAVFAICLILQVIDEAAKTANLQATVDLKQLLTFMRYHPDFGRNGFIDLAVHYDTIIKFAANLKQVS